MIEAKNKEEAAEDGNLWASERSAEAQGCWGRATEFGLAFLGDFCVPHPPFLLGMGLAPLGGWYPRGRWWDWSQ